MAENRAGSEEGKKWRKLTEGGEKSNLDTSYMLDLVDSAWWQKGAHVSKWVGRLSNKGPPPTSPRPSSGLSGRAERECLPHRWWMGRLGYILGQLRPQSRGS